MQDSRNMRRPVTRVDWPTDGTPAEFEIAGNAAKPTAITDPNVYPIPMVMKAINDGEDMTEVPEVEETWQFQFRTDNAASDAAVVLWFYNAWLDKWYPSTTIEVKGETLLDLSHGGVLTMNGVLGCSHVGVEVTGHAGNTLYLLHMWS